MRHLIFRTASLFLLLMVAAASRGADTVPVQNTLTSSEREHGWRLLFDGASLKGWSLYNSILSNTVNMLTFWRERNAAGGWVVDADGNLHRADKGGDLKTDQEFADFELKLEWKIAPGGNSGIFLRVNEASSNFAFGSGFEMQVLDNKTHRDGKSLLTSAGALYALYPAPGSHIAKPAGQWNSVRIIANKQHVVFYLNGQKTVDAVIGSADWEKRLAAAPRRLRSNEKFGRYPRGHIVLQDHGDEVWYRNIKIRELH